MSEGALWSSRQPSWRPALLAMLAAAVLAIVAAIWLSYLIYQAGQNQQPRYPYVPYLVFAIASTLISGITGLFLWLAYRRPESQGNLSNLERANLLGWLALEAFMVAATLGILPVVLEYNLGVIKHWFSRVSEGLSAWREWETWRPIVFTIGGLLGMMLAFLGLMGEERENPNLRRLIYGYNTFLSAVLLLGILIVLNAMAFAYGTRPFDWSATGIYTVHERMQRLLRNLTAPVDIYVFLDPQDDLYIEMRDYLQICQTYNREKFRVHYPLFGQSRELLRRLYERYRVRPDQSGILVVYDAEGRNAYQFIRREDLRTESRFGREPITFKGESALASAIVTLLQGPQKPVICFTSGAGEMTPSHSESDRNLRRLKERLEQQGYKVEELDLTKREGTGGIANEIYEAFLRAELLIIADPRATTLPPGYVDLLRLYMGDPAPQGFPEVLGLVQAMLQGPGHLFPPAALDWYLVQQARRGKGRLLIFTGADLTSSGEPTPCPLADFLKSYGVEAKKDLLVLPVNRRDLLTSPVVMISEQADRDWRAGMSTSLLDAIAPMRFCRSIEPTTSSDYVVSPLLQTRFPVYTLEERVLADDLLEHLQEQFERDPQGFQSRVKKQQTVAVTVRERSQRVPRDPFHAGVSGEGAPRLVVFGTAYLPLAAGVDDFSFNVVVSSIAWLRQRSELIDVGIPPRERKIFEPGPNFQNYSMNYYLLQGLLVFGLVITSGVGVYLVRRH